MVDFRELLNRQQLLLFHAQNLVKPFVNGIDLVIMFGNIVHIPLTPLTVSNFQILLFESHVRKRFATICVEIHHNLVHMIR